MLRNPTFWYIGLILLIMGMVGSMDYEDAVLHQKHYCKMVEEGAWPDYKNRCNRKEPNIEECKC